MAWHHFNCRITQEQKRKHPDQFPPFLSRMFSGDRFTVHRIEGEDVIMVLTSAAASPQGNDNPFIFSSMEEVSLLFYWWWYLTANFLLSVLLSLYLGLVDEAPQGDWFYLGKFDAYVLYIVRFYIWGGNWGSLIWNT